MSDTPPARIESDSLGDVEVPEGAWYGAQTVRAVQNFPISGQTMPPAVLKALGWIKEAAARVHQQEGRLPDDVADAIAAAAEEVGSGALLAQFPIDVYQTGSGTSTNMNANEVIANRANAALGGVVGSKEPVHPNDHVNMGQSSNDVMPTAVHMGAAVVLAEELLPALNQLRDSLRRKAFAWDDALKSGRTHLMDATPVRFGQVFGGYATQVQLGIERLEAARPRLHELALGGTAVGTGLNAPEGFAPAVIAKLARRTGLPLREARDHFEAQSARDALVELSGALKTLAASLTKIANDLRWMGSGPRTGFGELRLPENQPGSSIMPGKVNPVICESVVMACARVFGNDTTITISGAAGSFELNTMIPVMAASTLESLHLLAASAKNLADRCVDGAELNREAARDALERNLAVCTALAPTIGYDAAASISKEALASGRTVRAVAKERGVLSEEDLEAALDLRGMTE